MTAYQAAGFAASLIVTITVAQSLRRLLDRRPDALLRLAAVVLTVLVIAAVLVFYTR